MKKVTTYLFTIFMAMFWAFRIIVAFCYNLGLAFIITPYDFNFEIVLLFLTFIAMLLVIKRNIFGGIIYAAGYWLYFGSIIYKLIPSLNDRALMTTNNLDLLIASIGIILPILILLDLLINKDKKGETVNKKTDWFYRNKEYDRKFDERADRNEYRL